MADDKNNIANVPTATLENEYIAALVDEIERLREIAEAAAQYHDVACNPDWCRLCRALNAWKEARRG